jgi:hypothetical protein
MFFTPADFIQTFGQEVVDLTDCESGEFKEGTLEEILKLFDSPQDPGNPVWKVKVCLFLTSMCHVIDPLSWIVRTGHLKPDSEAANLPKYMKNSRIACHFPI